MCYNRINNHTVERNKLSYDYSVNLTEEEYENEKVRIFAEREALRKKQEEIDAFQREVAFEKSQLEDHEKAVEEQYGHSNSEATLIDIADHLTETYDLGVLPEGSSVFVSLLVPNADGTVTEHSVELTADDEDEECECNNPEDNAGSVIFESLLDQFKNEFGLSESSSEKEDAEEDRNETIKINVSLEEAFPELAFPFDDEQIYSLSKLLGFLK